ncbi:short-chain dehydrogenase [Oceanobacillus bengalensis]|uniref:Short-chain dehydrogenase n=1 Tax=Oceanobacillus bengalensis TaxID=1435466 RepID=A0A494Z3Q9_9BACI|nr:short-chain dehydrogenase [Oceanobacillus bengalensis]RKQ17165.1 short-chain dehydrogenase [Oceanobacillus bengalensis]
MKHALVIGGTGMLSNVSLWLLDTDYHVSIIARNAERMTQLIERANLKDRITPLLVDYTNEEALKEKVHATLKQNGDIEMVVAWIHSIGENALQIIANEVSKTNSSWELFHVLGSNSDLDELKRKAPVPVGYYQVQLGFVNEGSRSRWLTNKEISDGVIKAMKLRKNVTTIGQVKPRENRP